MSERVTLKGKVIAEIVAGNPGGRLKAIEYDQFGGIRRVEWHDDPSAFDEREADEVAAQQENFG